VSRNARGRSRHLSVQFIINVGTLVRDLWTIHWTFISTDVYSQFNIWITTLFDNATGRPTRSCMPTGSIADCMYALVTAESLLLSTVFSTFPAAVSHDLPYDWLYANLNATLLNTNIPRAATSVEWTHKTCYTGRPTMHCKRLTVITRSRRFITSFRALLWLNCISCILRYNGE